MTKVFPDFMGKASLSRIAGGDIAALGESIEALNAMIRRAHPRKPKTDRSDDRDVGGQIEASGQNDLDL